MRVRLLKGYTRLALPMPLQAARALCKVNDGEKPQSSNRSIQQEFIWELL